MVSDWKETILGELIEAGDAHLQTGPFGTALKAAEYSAEGVPLISVGEVRQGHFEVTGRTPRVSVETTKRLPKFVLEAGDIVFGRKGSIDRNAIVHPAQQGWFLGSDGIRLRLAKKHSSRFFSYQMRSPATSAWLLQNREGSTMPSLNQEILGRVPIVIPPLSEQKAIAHILGTLDDKIELNRRMNETLEAMAQTIFKSWFVDFDPVRAKAEGRDPGLPKPIADLFPDSFVDSELGAIPKGWITRPLYETADYVNGAAFKSEHFCDRSEGIPVVKIAELKNGITSQTNFSCRDLDPKQTIDTGDLLYSWSGSPDTSLDVFLWAKGPGLLNQHIFKVHTRDAAQMHFVYYLLKHLRPTLIEIARNKQTTGLGHVTVADMKRVHVPYPSKEVLVAFERHIGPIFDRVFLNTRESDGLATLRDALLPKLLLGDLPARKTKSVMEAHA